MNRSQRRNLAKSNRKRGIGYTRQYNSLRARQVIGTPDYGNAAKAERLRSEEATASILELFAKHEELRKDCEQILNNTEEESLIERVESGEFDDRAHLLSAIEEDNKSRETVLTALAARFESEYVEEATEEA